MVDKHILHKRSSLSTGEEIATSAANILRHYYTREIVHAHRGHLPFFRGYVDDCFFIWSGPRVALQSFLGDLRACDPDMLKWTFSEASNRVDFLDLTIEKHVDGRLLTSTFRKPGHNVQYLHGASFHPVQQKKSIFRGEVCRHLINTSPELQHRYDEDIKHILCGLRRRGHSHLLHEHTLVSKYDSRARDDLLAKMSRREFGSLNNSSTVEGAQALLFIIPYSRFIRSLRLKSLCLSLSRGLGLSDIDVHSGLRGGGSLFLSHYLQNFPAGCGRVGRLF